MDTHNNWWMDGQAVVDDDCPQPIPFPTRRARMSIRPPHASDTERENRMSAFNAGDALEAVSLVSRRIDDLARELDCLWYYDDDGEANPEPPTAA